MARTRDEKGQGGQGRPRRLQEETLFELSLQGQSGSFGEKRMKARRTLQTRGEPSRGCLGNRREMAKKPMTAVQLRDDTDTHAHRPSHPEKMPHNHPEHPPHLKQNPRELAQESEF